MKRYHEKFSSRMAFLQRDPGCSFRPPAAGGFTLIELLVVIGIIAILGGIMLPVISRALDQGKLAACQSNVRRLGEQLLLITTDGPPGGEPGDLVPHYGPTTQGQYLWFTAVEHSLDPGQKLESTKLNTGPKYFLCPKAKHDSEGRRNVHFGVPDRDGWDEDDLSYGYRRHILPGWRLSRFTSPSKIGMLSDSDGDRDKDSWIQFVSPAPFCRENNPQLPGGNNAQITGRRHRDGGNAVFFDGHVEWKEFCDLMESMKFFEEME